MAILSRDMLRLIEELTATQKIVATGIARGDTLQDIAGEHKLRDVRGIVGDIARALQAPPGNETSTLQFIGDRFADFARMTGLALDRPCVPEAKAGNGATPIESSQDEPGESDCDDSSTDGSVADAGGGDTVVPGDNALSSVQHDALSQLEALVRESHRFIAPTEAVDRIAQREVKAAGFDAAVAAATLRALPPKMRRVARLVAQGIPIRNIMLELGLTKGTVMNYKSMMYSAIGLTHMPEAQRVEHLQRAVALLESPPEPATAPPDAQMQDIEPASLNGKSVDEVLEMIALAIQPRLPLMASVLHMAALEHRKLKEASVESGMLRAELEALKSARDMAIRILTHPAAGS